MTIRRRLRAGRTTDAAHIRGQGSGLECQGCDSAGMAKRLAPASKVGVAAERSYPSSMVSGGQEETPCVRGQWRLGGDTPTPPRSGRRLEELPVSEAIGSQEETPRARGQGLQP